MSAERAHEEQDIGLRGRSGRGALTEPTTTIADVRRISAQLAQVNRQWRGWPGTVVRDPALTEPHYLQHRRLLLALAAAIERYLRDASDLLVVDIGAGKKPYYPLFAEHSRKYVGVDLPGTPGSNVYGQTEDLPLRSDVCDVVVSTQMLEHADDPESTLRECLRILKPGGVMFASTHGAAYYHPIPVDHWRWTHSGLRLMVERAGFDVLSVEATTRTLTTFATLAAEHFLGTANRLRIAHHAARLLVPFNWLISVVDGVHRHPPIPEGQVPPGALPWTYLVVGRKPAYSLIQNVTGGVTVPSKENVTEGTGVGRGADDGQ